MSLLDVLKPAPAIPTSHEALPRRVHRLDDDKKKTRLAAIAAAAQKHPGAAVVPRVRPHPSQENNDMAKDSFEQLLQFLKDDEQWHGPAEIAKKLGHPRASTVTRLATLAKQGKIQAIGKRRSLRYAARGVAQPSPANIAATIPAKAERKPATSKRRAGAKAAGTAARARKPPAPPRGRESRARPIAARPRSSSTTPAASRSWARTAAAWSSRCPTRSAWPLSSRPTPASRPT